MKLANQDGMLQRAFVALCTHLEQQQPWSNKIKLVKVKIKPETKELRVAWSVSAGLAILTMPNRVYLGRCLSDLITFNFSKDSMKVSPIIFPEVAFSLDLSRNGVMKLATIQKFIGYLATMGYTQLYLYLEDTYVVPGQPYHGYLRGSYTKSDLQDIDDFAFDYGIEVVPCIQTLAHLQQLLKWSQYQPVTDTNETLMVNNPETYRMIRSWLTYFKQVFRSNRIHLGLDEANNVGRGHYLDNHSYQNQVVLMQDHINHVVELCRELALQPEIWSDFIYRTLDRKHQSGYYALTADLDLERAQQLPKDIAYCYWDYGETSQKNYQVRLRNHRLFSNKVHFAGAAHIYGNLVPNYAKSWASLMPALAACQAEQVEQVMLTTWGDDGQETAHWLALPLMQAFAERCYHQSVTLAQVASKFDCCVQPQLFNWLWSLTEFDIIPNVQTDNYWMANPSKYLLWQDPLLGLFDADLNRYQDREQLDLTDYYFKLSQRLRNAPQTAAIWKLISDFYYHFAQVLALKSTLGLRLQAAYLSQNTKRLEEISNYEIPDLITRVSDMKREHQNLWHATYRPFGWETLESRYALLESRLKTTNQKIKSYLATPNDQLIELASSRQLFSSEVPLERLNVPNYKTIAFTGYY